MNRRIFISNTGKIILGGTLLPPSHWSDNSIHAVIIKGVARIIGKFVGRVLQKGVEKYATDSLVDWLGKVFDSENELKQKTQELPPVITGDQLYFYGDNTQVFYGYDSQKQPTISMFPIVTSSGLEELSKKITTESYVPIFHHNYCHSYFNFPEIIGLEKLAQTCYENHNMGAFSKNILKDMLLPFKLDPKKYRVPFQVSILNGHVGSCIFETSKGIIHVIYDVKDNLQLKGEISFKARSTSFKIQEEKVEFFHDFSEI